MSVHVDTEGTDDVNLDVTVHGAAAYVGVPRRPSLLITMWDGSHAARVGPLTTEQIDTVAQAHVAENDGARPGGRLVDTFTFVPQ